MDWELGVIEAICLTILAGFSVDYVVHLAHAYMDAGHAATREDRVRRTFEDIGISVFSGMITSVTAAQPLFACTLQFFAKFGGFLCFTVFFSWCFANFFFMACLAEFGPQPPDEVGSVRWLTCGALDLSMHKEKQAAAAVMAATRAARTSAASGRLGSSTWCEHERAGVWARKEMIGVVTLPFSAGVHMKYARCID